jgi:hypothetical protein
MAEAPGSRTQPARETRAATDFEDREGHRAPFASVHFDYIVRHCAAHEFPVASGLIKKLSSVSSDRREESTRYIRS